MLMTVDGRDTRIGGGCCSLVASPLDVPVIIIIITIIRLFISSLFAAQLDALQQM
jgi:hypothetical protein